MYKRQGHVPWLPTVAAQVQPCARMPLEPYVRPLVKATVTAVVRALSHDAASKTDRKLALVRTLPHTVHSRRLKTSQLLQPLD